MDLRRNEHRTLGKTAGLLGLAVGFLVIAASLSGARADPGREFAFRVLPDWFNKDSSIWRYRLETEGEGTRLSEETNVLEWPGLVVRALTTLARRDEDATDNIHESLDRIKAIVESSATVTV